MNTIIRFVLTVFCGLFVVMANATTTTQLVGDTFNVVVPAGETYTLLESDMSVIGERKDICKCGEGMLILSTNESSALESAYKNWVGKMIVSNGCLRLDTDYVLGKYSSKGGGDTYVEDGASLIVNYSRVENVDGTTGGWIQNEIVHLKGKGFQGEGALYQTLSSHIVLGTLFLEDDAWIGKKDYSSISTQYRYKYIEFNGHELHVSSNAYFSTVGLSFRVGAESKLIVESGARWGVSGALSLSSTSANLLPVEFADASILEVGATSAAIPADVIVPEGASSIIYINGVISSTAADSIVGGTVLVDGKLSVAFANNSYSCKVANAIRGGGTFEISGGCLTIGESDHRFRTLRFGTRNNVLGSLALPKDYVLTVQGLETNDIRLADGEYGPADLPSIVSGRIKVDSNFEVFESSASDEDVDVQMRSASSDSSCECRDARVTINAFGSSSAYITDKTLAELLGRAHTRLDATATNTFTFHTTWTSKSGDKGITSWKSRNGGDYEAKNWSKIVEGLPTDRRYVRAYTTIKEHTVNGLTRPYVDFGEEDGGNERYDTNFSASNETASAMEVTTDTLKGREFHIVHADAHPNTDGKTYRNVLGLGRTNQQDAGNTYPGRRSPEGMLFYQGTSYAAAGCYGKIWVDNVSTNSTYIPEWDEVNVYTVLPTNAFEGVTSDFTFYNALGSDSYGRYGGMRIGEILIYSGATNTASERESIDAYLLKKWKNVGKGPLIPLGPVNLEDAALTLASDCSDIGCTYQIRSLSGKGSLTASERDIVQIETVVANFETRTECTTVEVGSVLDLGLASTIKIKSSVLPKAGKYVLIRTSGFVGEDNFVNWTFDYSESGLSPERAKVSIDGNDIVLEIQPNGLVLVVK